MINDPTDVAADAVAPPPATAPLAPHDDVPAPVERLQFTGKAGEYFGIWIVNLFLTIVTLGIYSAWAKVRKKRYFYGNTWVAGANFEYHGNPIAILKGRILAFGAFAAYTLGAQFSPRIAGLVALAFMPVLPWLLVRSFAFNAVNSSYRNLRFHFNATYRDAAVAIGPAVLFPLLAVVLPQVQPGTRPTPAQMMFAFTPLAVLWLVYPYLVGRTRLLHVNHSRYGTAPFSCTARIASFYKIYILATLLSIPLMLFFVVAGVAVVFAPTVGIALLPVAYILFGASLFGYTQSRLGNLIFNATTLDGRLRFGSHLKARKLAGIFGTNILAVLFTLGLAIPWATIRTLRYRAECAEVHADEGLESFLADVAVQVGATGEAMGEMFDVDLSL